MLKPKLIRDVAVPIHDIMIFSYEARMLSYAILVESRAPVRCAESARPFA
jgi:hypothetical protein